MKAELILKSSCVFTAAGEPPFAGYVALGGGHILAVGHGEPESALIRYLRLVLRIFSMMRLNRIS